MTFDPETVNYDTILQLVLVSLNRPHLYTQVVHEPLSVWDASSGRPVQPGVGSLALDVDMQVEFGGAFGEPTVSTKHVNSASQFKLPSDVYASLFKAPRVDEELLRAIGPSRAPPQSSELRKAFDALYESSMASWRLGWHLTVLSQFLKQQNIQDPVTRAVISHMHSAIQESRKVSATGASSAIAASCRMVLDSPACHGWQALRPKLLGSPYGGTNLFGGSFDTHIECATRTLEQLAQVRRLTAPQGYHHQAWTIWSSTCRWPATAVDRSPSCSHVSTGRGGGGTSF